jgi:hypothetical protein
MKCSFQWGITQLDLTEISFKVPKVDLVLELLERCLLKIFRKPPPQFSFPME